MKIIIIVASHKKYQMPKDDVYLPVQVGAEGKENLGYTRDCDGDNISQKNSSFCELTGLYWAWKNANADYIGLVHYRRHFTKRKSWIKSMNHIADGDVFRELLKDTDLILPKKRHYFIETNYSQYVHAHHEEDLEITEEIIRERYPEYLKAYEDVMGRTSGHRFNMFVMKKDILEAYCSWLFSILLELEKRLNISNYSTYDRRVFGFVGERLMDVWIEKNQVRYEELPYMFMEKQNWLVKGGRFLKRKFLKGNVGKNE